MPEPELAFQVRILGAQYECALALIFHRARNCQLGRDVGQHLHVSRHQIALDDLNSYILQCERDMVLAHPFVCDRLCTMFVVMTFSKADSTRTPASYHLICKGKTFDAHPQSGSSLPHTFRAQGAPLQLDLVSLGLFFST